LQHRVALRRKNARLQGGHPSRLVHFFGERMDIENPAARVACGRMEDAKALIIRGGEEERFRRGPLIANHCRVFCSTNALRLPSVANVDASISSSATWIPKCSSSASIRLTTAIESSSGIAPSNGVAGDIALALPPTEACR